MAAQPQERVRKRLVWFSPFLFVVALTPALLTCFVATTAMAAPNETCEGHCGGQSPDGCWCDDQCSQYGDCCPDYELACNVEPPPPDTCEGSCGGQSPDGCYCDDQCTQYGDCCPDHEQWCVQSVFPCTEQGILDAIALGGGPHTFVCSGPTTVTTQGEIFIYNDVILDGEGNLTIDGNDDHRVLSVVPGVTAELVGMTVSGGRLDAAQQGAGILNEGTLTITDGIIESNSAAYAEGSAIYNAGTLTLFSSGVSGNGGFESAVYSAGTLTLMDSQVSDNFSADGAAIRASGTLTLINSAVVNARMYEGIVSSGTTTVRNSAVKGSYYYPAIVHSGGTLTLSNSTVGPQAPGLSTIRISNDANMVVSNSLIVGVSSINAIATCTGTGSVTSLGGNIESPTNDCGLTDPTDLVNVSADDLKLGPFADNGGPTMTRALLPGSVAIDRIPEAMCLDTEGQPLTNDQRGVARPQGSACDVGAFEWADCSGSACDDGNDCTADYCDPPDDSWCVNNPLPDCAQ